MYGMNDSYQNVVCNYMTRRKSGKQTLMKIRTIGRCTIDFGLYSTWCLYAFCAASCVFSFCKHWYMLIVRDIGEKLLAFGYYKNIEPDAALGKG